MYPFTLCKVTSRLSRRAVRSACAGVLLCLAACAAAPRASAQDIARVYDSWHNTLIPAIKRTLEQTHARQISRETASSQFVSYAEQVRELAANRAEREDGLLTNGVQGSSNYSACYYPGFVRGFCFWQAAQLTGDTQKKIQFFEEAARALESVDTLSGKNCRRSEVYRNAAIIRKMYIASKFAALDFKADVNGYTISSADLASLRQMLDEFNQVQKAHGRGKSWVSAQNRLLYYSRVNVLLKDVFGGEEWQPLHDELNHQIKGLITNLMAHISPEAPEHQLLVASAASPTR